MTKLLTEWDPRLKRKPPMLAEAKMEQTHRCKKEGGGGRSRYARSGLEAHRFSSHSQAPAGLVRRLGRYRSLRPRHIAAAEGQASDARRGPVVGQVPRAIVSWRFSPRGSSIVGGGSERYQTKLQVHGWMYGLPRLRPPDELVRRRQLRRVQSGNGRRKAYRYFKP